MKKDYEKMFQGLVPIKVPENLEERIFARISFEARRKALWRLIFLGPLAAVSAAAAVLAFQYAAQEVAQSGFYQYLSIAVSDAGALAAYGKDLLLLLAESAPILGVAIFFGAVLALLGSLRSMVRNAQTVFTHVMFAH